MPIYRRPPPRRPFRRRFPPGRPPRPAARQALLRLRKAHALMAQGDFEQAAHILDGLANAAAKRGIDRAPNLALQAARAWFEAGKTDRGMEMTRMAMQYMHRVGQLQKLHQVSGRILSELRSRGLTQEAAAIEAEIKEMLAGVDVSSFRTMQPARTAHLPPQCPQCGGNVRSDEVEWIDGVSATCNYCGSVLVQES
ncbi:MAG TPA: hypothetical protein G4O08_12685 [Anaerolineae bacterium]|nr:hypothetical protein [Anaerolineae bacterium]